LSKKHTCHLVEDTRRVSHRAATRTVSQSPTILTDPRIEASAAVSPVTSQALQGPASKRSTEIPETCVQSSGLQGADVLVDASALWPPACSMAARRHGCTSSHFSVAGEARGGKRVAGALTATAVARRRGGTPTGKAVTPPPSTPACGWRGDPQGARAGGWARPPRDRAPLSGA